MNFAVNVVVVLNRTCLMTLKLDCLKLLGVESCYILKLPVLFSLQGENSVVIRGSFSQNRSSSKMTPLQKDGTLVWQDIFWVWIAMTFLFNSGCWFFFGRIFKGVFFGIRVAACRWHHWKIGRNRNLHEFLISSDCGVKSPEAESPYASMAKQMTEDVIELTQDFL